MCRYRGELTSVNNDGTFGVAYEDGEEEEAVPLEELFHELQARFAEISRDSPRLVEICQD